MSELNLDRLKKNKEAILKVEIVSMLTLWEKISPNGSINKANIKLSDINWENELKNKEISFKKENNEELKNYKVWDNFLNDWRSWRRQHSSDYLLQILYGISESLNSGIDKGSPKKEVKVEPEDKRWLSNAFGSFKRNIIYLEKDKINTIIDEIKDKILCSLNKTTISSDDLEEIRNKLKELLSGLLSDDRFPINDVSLWEQTYMPTSMFKALLSNYILTNSDFTSIPDRQQVKWRILGIQYDKIGIAEKSLKLASIFWYRNVTRDIDEEIKKLLEVEYPIGNEIYRDETGIYFIVGEDLGEDLDDGSNLAEFKLKELEDKILEIFKEKTKDEFYPAIFLTKASRGLMNLSYLLERAKENFLKVNWKQKDLNLWLTGTIKGKAIGICPVCQTRLIYEKDKEKRNQPTICKVCDERVHHKQASKWIDNLTGETIWIEEIKDKKNRVVYISLKFELEDWLNGNLLNSLLGRKGNYYDNLNKIKLFISLFLLNKSGFLDNEISKLESQILELTRKLGDSTLSGDIKRNLGQQKGTLTRIKSELLKAKNIINKLVEEKWQDNPLDKKYSLQRYSNWDIDNYIEKVGEILKNYFNYLEVENPFIDLAQDAYYGCKRNGESFNDFIKQIFFGSILGTAWEEWIKQTPLNSKIDWEKEKIKWEEFTDENDLSLDLLATLLLQFLLRKNPSPARLRRIWKTTQEFFENIYKNLESILNIPGWRKQRLVWEVNLNGDNKLEKSMELEGEGLLFWAEKKGNKAKIYLISSIRDFLLKFGDGKAKKDLNNQEEFDIYKEILKDKNTFKSSSYIQNAKIELYPYSNKNDNKNKINIDIKSNLKEIHTYKPFTSIIEPSPINYQIIIPAEYLPNLIDEVISRYNKEFKYVYGKLPIHIGIVISDYKKPVYINLKALRKIRRDVEDIDKLYRFPKAETFKKLYFIKFLKEYNFSQINNNNIEQIEKSIVNNNGEIEDIDEKVSIEIKNGTYHYYSLYWNNPNDRDYNFYIKPKNNWQKWISTIDKFNPSAKIQIIPNTFDFEYLDHNIRRDEIFYDGSGKRVIPLKNNRPYELEIYWGKFKKFRELFTEANLNPTRNSTRLHKLVELLYSKLQNEKDYNSDYSYLFTSSFIELLELNRKGENYSKRREIINDIFDLGIDSFEELSKEFVENLQQKLTKKENIYLFLDMFEFWHTAMKEV